MLDTMIPAIKPPVSQGPLGSKLRPYSEFNIATVFARNETSMMSFYVTVSPALAKQWLERYNTDNRALRRKRAKSYAQDIASGKFKTTGEAIMFDQNGVLQNGQHRLQAVVDSNCSQTFYITFFCEPEDRDVLDQGLNRNVNDDLERLKYNNRTILASSARLLKSWYTGTWNNAGDLKSNVVDFIQAHPRLDELSSKAANIYTKTGSNKPALVVFMYLASQDGTQIENLDRFLDKLSTGENLNGGDPILRALNEFRKLSNRRDVKPRHYFEILAYCWNRWVTGKVMPKRGINFTDNLPSHVVGGLVEYGKGEI